LETEKSGVRKGSGKLIGIVLWGTLSGSMLPFIMRRLGFDPAASSAPFVATLVDVTGLVIYFSVAATILRGDVVVKRGACSDVSLRPDHRFSR
jgi:hypothetical protein